MKKDSFLLNASQAQFLLHPVLHLHSPPYPLPFHFFFRKETPPRGKQSNRAKQDIRQCKSSY